MSVLVCMRLENMARVHPQQVERPCSRCQTTCGVYPSGQAALAADPELEIVCHICSSPFAPSYVGVLAPGAIEEASQTIKKGEA